MHFNGRLSAPFRKVLLSTPLPSCPRPGVPQPHPKISRPCQRAPGLRAGCCGTSGGPRSRVSACPEPAPAAARPAAARPASPLFRPRTYLLSEHFRRSLPRFFLI